MLLRDHQIILQKQISAVGFEKLSLVRDAADAMLSDQETKKSFSTYASEISRIIKYLDRDDMTDETRSKADAILAVFRQMQSKRKHINITSLMVTINQIINENIEIQQADENEFILAEHRRFDISQIDFGPAGQGVCQGKAEKPDPEGSAGHRAGKAWYHA